MVHSYTFGSCFRSGRKWKTGCGFRGTRECGRTPKPPAEAASVGGAVSVDIICVSGIVSISVFGLAAGGPTSLQGFPMSGGTDSTSGGTAELRPFRMCDRRTTVIAPVDLLLPVLTLAESARTSGPPRRNSTRQRGQGDLQKWEIPLSASPIRLQTK